MRGFQCAWLDLLGFCCRLEGRLSIFLRLNFRDLTAETGDGWKLFHYPRIRNGSSFYRKGAEGRGALVDEIMMMSLIL